MYTKKHSAGLFATDITYFYKDGYLIATRDSKGWHRYPNKLKGYGCSLTRAQGYRYWQRHFPGLPCWLLPEPLEEATDLEPEYKGEYTDKSGEVIGVFG